MLRIIAVIVVIWLALLPPFFTDGACTAEFDREAARLEGDSKLIASPTLAQSYWNGRQISSTLFSMEQCRRAKPRFVESCGKGPLLYASVPVQNRVCRLYRDDEIRVQLQYDERGRLARIITDMNSFMSLPLPLIGVLHWGR